MGSFPALMGHSAHNDSGACRAPGQAHIGLQGSLPTFHPLSAHNLLKT